MMAAEPGGDTPMEETMSTTVTLTNWKRLTNTTIVFTTDAQAVVWKEYVIIIDRGSAETLHFYHLKHKLWSKVSANIPSSGGEDSAVSPMCGHALVVHNASLIILSTSGYVYEFSENKWILRSELTVQFYDSFKAYKDCGIFASISLGGDTLDHESLILLESQDLDGYGQSSLHTFRYFQLASRWSQPKKLQKGIPYYQHDSSFTTTKGRLYVSNGKQTYCINLQKPGAETIPIAEMTWSHLDLHQYTISAVDGTLFAFGGKDEEDQPSSDIYRYSSSSKVWEPAGYMRNAQYSALVIPVTEINDKSILVIGGNMGSKNNECRIMESCEVHTR